MQGFLRCFRDPIRVPRIESRVPRIRENYHQVPRIRENEVPRITEIGSLLVHTGYLTFSLKKSWSICIPMSNLHSETFRLTVKNRIFFIFFCPTWKVFLFFTLYDPFYAMLIRILVSHVSLWSSVHFSESNVNTAGRWKNKSLRID